MLSHIYERERERLKCTIRVAIVHKKNVEILTTPHNTTIYTHKQERYREHFINFQPEPHWQWGIEMIYSTIQNRLWIIGVFGVDTYCCVLRVALLRNENCEKEGIYCFSSALYSMQCAIWCRWCFSLFQYSNCWTCFVVLSTIIEITIVYHL